MGQKTKAYSVEPERSVFLPIRRRWTVPRIRWSYIYVCSWTNKGIPRSVEAYRRMIKCLETMDKIDVCRFVRASHRRFYAAREPPLWGRNGFPDDIRTVDGYLLVRLWRKYALR